MAPALNARAQTRPESVGTTLEHTPMEGKALAGWCLMLAHHRPMADEFLAQEIFQLMSIVVAHGKPAALFGPSVGVSRNDECPSGTQSRKKGGLVTSPLSFLGHEMKGGAIMPDIVHLRRLPIGYVENQKLHTLRVLAETLTGLFER